MTPFHPQHVVDALARIDDMPLNDLEPLLLVRDRKSPNYIVSEAMVRLLRRARVEDDRPRERLLVRELHRRVDARSRRKYSGLHDDDRDEFVQEVSLRLFEEIGSGSGIDFWEITFDRNLGRIAADAYQEQFARWRDQQGSHVELDAGQRDDDGQFSAELEHWALCVKGALAVLDEREIAVFYPMFVEGLPLASAKASIDLIRLTGIPEGTLREMKTRMTKKLKELNLRDTR